MVTVKINGKEITVEDNTLILDAARNAGYEIPTFCYQADLMGIGSCRMCLVEIEGQRKLQPSCVTPVLHGMSILTETSSVQTARASVLEFLLANHAMDCPVCDKGGECELQDMVFKYGPHKGRHAEPKFKFHEKDYVLSPVIVKNSNRCVQCLKCVRVCNEVVGASVLGAMNRGDHQEPTSFMRTYLDCDHCGNCIEVCPVGCFMRLPYRYKARPWDLKGADTICPHCSTGCRMVVEQRGGEVVRARAQYGVGLNSETLCARGRFGNDYVTNPERIKSPLIRRGGNFEPVSWEEAFNYIADNLATVGREVGGIASARLANEDLFVFQSLMRDVLKTPNVDSGSRWDPIAVERFIEATGMSEGATSVFECMEADTVLVVGAHLSDENPITDYTVRRISANRRMNVIILSPRAMKLDSSANMKLRHLPSEEGTLLDAIGAQLYASNAEKLANSDRATRLKGADSRALSEASGIRPEQVVEVAKRLGAANSVSIIAGTSFLRYPEAIEGLSTMRAILKGLGKKVLTLPVFDRANQRGAWEMGVHPGLLPGYKRAHQAGLGTDGMLNAAMKNELEALYVAGCDLLAMYPDRNFAKDALSKLKFLIVQDLFMTETAAMAHVVLPSASATEKDATFTNQEGRVQRLRRLELPMGKVKPDYEVFSSLATTIDRSFVKEGFAAIFERIRKATGTYEKVSLAFENKRNTNNKLDNKEALVSGAGAAFEARKGEFKKSRAAEPKDGGFYLVTGNSLYHSGIFSRRSNTLLELQKEASVEISDEDAEALGLKSGSKVRLRGRHFEATVTLKTKKGTRRGVAFLSENFDVVPVNRYSRRGEGIQLVELIKTV